MEYMKIYVKHTKKHVVLMNLKKELNIFCQIMSKKQINNVDFKNNMI